jgi:hypothetical protein
LYSYLSLLPSPNDAVLSFGPMDTLLTPAQHYIPTRLYNLFPHPAQDSGEKRKYIAVLSSRYFLLLLLIIRLFLIKIFSLEMLMFPVRWYVICTRKVGVHSIAW